MCWAAKNRRAKRLDHGASRFLVMEMITYYDSGSSSTILVCSILFLVIRALQVVLKILKKEWAGNGLTTATLLMLYWRLLLPRYSFATRRDAVGRFCLVVLLATSLFVFRVVHG